MRVARCLCILGLWLAVAPVAWADNPTPQVAPPTAVVVQPTTPPMVDTAPTPNAPAAVESTPVAPAKEFNQPTVSVPESSVPPAAGSTPPASYETGPSSPGVTLNPNPQPRAQTHISALAPNNVSGNGAIAGPSSASGSAPSTDISSITAPYVSVSSQAPSQLSCRGKQTGTALPFLVSPYGGWTEFVSFLDHDSPDYTVDGTIVLANGISATSSGGQESDLWPAYWSPSLRQYVNYDGHNGYDFALSYQPILAAGAGTVSFAGWNSSDAYAGYGQMVLIDHHNGYVTLYGHLSKIEVNQGDRVTAGQEIGISGTTGHSSGPHLHFSVFHNCHVTDPYGWTGQGTDPLYTFDGEHASYLWLPGRDPLVVNPPRDWPAFPSGLRLSVARGDINALTSAAGPSRTPAVDRLLLLDLPESQSVGTSSPAVALARTEASITQEAETLAPALDDLKSQGLIQRFQVIPAAAAVWLRGTANATQLLSLPGVASLAGVQAHDLAAAQTGLAHDVLIQIQHQQAPSLWPVGFRSALHAWRPMMTVVNAHALVTGSALPGQTVTLALRRKGGIVGVAEATADVNSGGFVAMLHDLGGNPVVIRAGDVVSIVSDGKRDSMTIIPFTMRVRSDRVSGQAKPGLSIPVSLTRVGGSVFGESVATSLPSGAFSLTATDVSRQNSLAAGTLAVGTMADSSGDQEAANAFVPGAQIFEGSALMRGWAVGDAPRLELIRHGKVLVSSRIRSAPDGTFQLELRRDGRLIQLMKGDVLHIGSRQHPRIVTLPELSLQLQSGDREIRFSGPTDTRLVLTVSKANGRSTLDPLETGRTGAGSVAAPDGPLTLGDTASLKFETKTGDQVYARGQARGILIQVGSASVTGTVRPGSVLSIHVLSIHGKELAGAVTTTRPDSGTFKTQLRTKNGQSMRLHPGMQVLVRDGSLVSTTTVPKLQVVLQGPSVISSAITTPRQVVTWMGTTRSGHSALRHLQANARGQLRDRFTVPGDRKLTRVVVMLALGQGVTVQAAATVTRKPGAPTRRSQTSKNRARTSVRTTSRKSGS